MADTQGRVTLWGIEVFAAAAEELSISASARRLGASPSAVSQQLTNLETALSTTLLDRSARPMVLTPAGALFLRRAQRILTEAAAARAELASRDLSQLTTLGLGMIEDLEADVTPALLAEMGQKLEGTRFRLETGASHRLYDRLDSRALDVVVAAETDALAPWMELHPLLDDPFVAVVPKGLLVGGDSLRKLRTTPLIRYTKRHLMGRQIADHLAREALRVEHRYEIDSYHSILAMVARGAGWSILTPLGIMRAGRFTAEVDIAPLPFAPISRRISLVARAEALWDMPRDIAGRLRPLLNDLIVAPSHARMPWLGDALRVL
ncbi:MAG: LysR family transcriptional regulator [Pseudomonadota bacterium]